MSKKGKCRVCKKPVTEKYMPFCSKHCADVDLGRWLNESYKVADNETGVDQHHGKEQES